MPPVQGPGYAGHVVDVSTGLSYMQQRYYDPLAGRFFSTDPMPASAGSFNRYAYANNSPYKYIDPDGRETECAKTTGSNLCGPSSAGSQLATTARPDVPSPTKPNAVSTPAQSQPKSFQQKTGDVVADSWEALIDQILPAVGPEETFVVGGMKILGASIIGGRIGQGAANANKLYHIFGKTEHNLGPVLKEFGSEEAAFNAIKAAAESVVKSQGISGVFERAVQVGSAQVTVRGNVSNGAVQIGTAFIP
jgi:RHS repeat-associated protein